MTQIVTRRQLQAYGMSKYHAQIITKGLSPLGRQGQAYIYDLSQVIASINDYIKRPRIQKATRKTLEEILTVLRELLGNVVEIPFSEDGDPEIRKVVAKLTQAMAKTDASLAALKADAAEIKQRYDATQ
ncbi:hypothetical protein [Leptolyngbya sp. PCC 6406]|uniref:hypothetical protein n=1 Tax=Leptolyngbya sp. PCC 6406 TaxID=1173264 RepID=UPI0002ABACA4|nr:hypothetical protein [Leptolyngbya sp. PCC 6406]